MLKFANFVWSLSKYKRSEGNHSRMKHGSLSRTEWSVILHMSRNPPEKNRGKVSVSTYDPITNSVEYLSVEKPGGITNDPSFLITCQFMSTQHVQVKSRSLYYI